MSDSNDVYEEMARHIIEDDSKQFNNAEIVGGAAILRALFNEDGTPRAGGDDIMASIIGKIINSHHLDEIEFDEYERQFMVNLSVLMFAAGIKEKYPDAPFEL